MAKALLIYDGDCPLCQNARRWVETHAAPGTIETLPCQSEELGARVAGLALEECLEAMRLVTPDGRVYVGAEALEALLPQLRGPWSWLRGLFRVPGMRRLAPLFYAGVARNRHALSAMVVKKSPQRCGDDNCAR